MPRQQTIYEYYGIRVRRGAKLLDKARPGWEKDINLQKLQLSNTAQCMLGQLYGDYTEGKGLLASALEAVRATYKTVPESDDYFVADNPDQLQGEHYGFDVIVHVNNKRGWRNEHAYSVMTELWSEIIESRRRPEVDAERERRAKA